MRQPVNAPDAYTVQQMWIDTMRTCNRHVTDDLPLLQETPSKVLSGNTYLSLSLSLSLVRALALILFILMLYGRIFFMSLLLSIHHPCVVILALPKCCAIDVMLLLPKCYASMRFGTSLM